MVTQLFRRASAQVALVTSASAASFRANRGLVRAASLAFYCFMALPPLLLLISILLSRIFTFRPGIEDAFRQFMEHALPFAADTVLVEIETLARQRGWGIASLLVLFWSVTPLAAAIRHCMTDSFRTHRKRSFFFSKGADVLAVVVLLVTLLALTVLESFKHILFSLGTGGLVRLTVQVGLPLLICTLLLAFVFMITAPVRLRLYELLLGASVTALLLLSVGPAMSLFLRINPRYGYTFGSLKTLFLLIVWVYYAFAAILFGCEVMANVHRRDALLLARLFRRGRAGWLDAPLLRRFIRALTPGETLFDQSTDGREMFYVLTGQVDMRVDDRVVKTCKPGDYFGEMALLLEAARTAQARAGTDGAEIVTVAPDTLDEILRENPDVMLDLLRELARRLQATNRLMTGSSPAAT